MSDCCLVIRTANDMGNKKFDITPANANTDPTVCCSKSLGITCSDKNVTGISWPEEGLTGKIPEYMEQLRSLKTLNLSHNSIYGGFPEYFTTSNITDM